MEHRQKTNLFPIYLKRKGFDGVGLYLPWSPKSFYLQLIQGGNVFTHNYIVAPTVR